MHRLRATGLLAAFFCAWAGTGGAWLLAQSVEGPKDQAAVKLGERIARLIGDLGNPRHAVREAAQDELIRIGYPALPALREAAGSKDAEVAARAQGAMETLLAHTHAIFDALEEPITGAEVRIDGAVWGEEGGKGRTFLTDAMGHVDIPPPAGPPGREPIRAAARVSHPKYGIAPVRLEMPAWRQKVVVPLVRQGTEEGGRALRGTVVGPDGEPLAGAAVRCGEVRTPGEGLITPQDGQVVLTDERGRFAMYPVPTSQRAGERGRLIPPNSTFRVQVSHEADESLFPRIAKLSNAAEAKVQLLRPTRLFRLSFEGPDGRPVTDAATLKDVVLSHQEDRELGGVSLPARYVAEGKGKLLPGTYSIHCPTLRYLPVTVAADSPEALTFRLAPPVTFHGRVVHGVTGAPRKGAFVMGWSGTARNNLAMLTGEQWKALHALPARPALDDEALTPVGRMYSIQAIGRTDEHGRFELAQPLAQRFYAVMAFEEDFVPFKVRTYDATVTDDHRAAVADLPLYPAAKVFVRPVWQEVEPGRRLSVNPRWRLLKDGQPEWVGRFREALPYQASREFEYIHWMELNERQPLHVPAGVLLKLALEAPYDDQWTTATVDRVIRLGQGESVDLGDVSFHRALRVQVRVVDGSGDPVEGAPVRRCYGAEGVWCVPHNTDAKGLATLYVDANSTGRFRGLDFGRASAAKAANAVIPFRIGKAADPDKPFVIRLTDEQVRALRGLRRKNPPPATAPAKVQIRN